jgi:hypothetical protein
LAAGRGVKGIDGNHGAPVTHHVEATIFGRGIHGGANIIGAHGVAHNMAYV